MSAKLFHLIPHIYGTKYSLTLRSRNFILAMRSSDSTVKALSNEPNINPVVQKSTHLTMVPTWPKTGQQSLALAPTQVTNLSPGRDHKNSFGEPLETLWQTGVLCPGWYLSFTGKPNTLVLYTQLNSLKHLKPPLCNQYSHCKIFTSNSYNLYIKYNQ